MKLFINTEEKGEHLYPLTKDLPKPMIPIAGKPILHHLIDWAKLNRINEIVMMNGYMYQKIVDYFGNSENFGFKIIHSNEPYPLGSRGPLRFAKKYIDGRQVHISGDHICKINLERILEFHKKNNSKITVVVHKSTHPEDSDILEIDNKGRVINSLSKYDNNRKYYFSYLKET